MKHIQHPTSPSPSRRGFTLIEMLVVIGIIGILAGIMLTTFSGSNESSRAAQCLANMKNLASAAQTYAMETKFYPLAGNMVYGKIDKSQGRRNVRRKYEEQPGWISMDTQDKYPSQSYVSVSPIDMYTDDEEKALYALTNGVLWKYVGGNRNTYVCPLHAKRSGNAQAQRARWSYLMNAYFTWNAKDHSYASDSGRRKYGELPVADKMLLFSEVPFSGYNGWTPSGGGTDGDAILQYATTGLRKGDLGAGALSPGNEEIGVNHVYKGNAFAHVAFADGHVEKLRVPMQGKTPDTSQMKELTTWLCAGKDVSFTGKKYEKVEE